MHKRWRQGCNQVMSKPTWTLVLILSTLLTSCAQTTKHRGLLILDYSRTDTSFDLFLPCDIDENKTLTENIKFIKTDTAKWISLSIVKNYVDIIDKSIKIENEGNETMADNYKFKRVIPVDIEIDKRFDGRQYNNDFDFGELEIKLLGQVISPGYDARQNLTLSKAKIIRTR
jgi:hypothetical protein